MGQFNGNFDFYFILARERVGGVGARQIKYSDIVPGNRYGDFDGIVDRFSRDGWSFAPEMMEKLQLGQEKFGNMFVTGASSYTVI